MLKNLIKKPSLIENKYININGFYNSIINYSLSGFKLAPECILQERLNLCKECDYWDVNGFKKTGRCQKCGCSTWAKLRMATERCPIGKWEAVDK